MLEFVGILSDSLEQNILADWGDLILISNFNVHMDNPTDSDTIIFNDFLDSFNLVNKIDFEMHQNHHTLEPSSPVMIMIQSLMCLKDIT